MVVLSVWSRRTKVFGTDVESTHKEAETAATAELTQLQRELHHLRIAATAKQQELTAEKQVLLAEIERMKVCAVGCTVILRLLLTSCVCHGCLEQDAARTENASMLAAQKEQREAWRKTLAKKEKALEKEVETLRGEVRVQWQSWLCVL